MTWLEVCHDKSLRDLPYKVELNRWGNIEMSPHRRQHSVMQGRISAHFSKLMSEGEVAVECAIDTSDGVRVPDVAWVSTARWNSMSDSASCSIAPEICVEVVSASHTAGEMEHKRKLYFDAGAKEVWFCTETGELQFFSPQGTLTRSALCPQFPARI
jgi:Uma2 family endonuclease